MSLRMQYTLLFLGACWVLCMAALFVAEWILRVPA